MNNRYLQIAVLIILAALALFVIRRKSQTLIVVTDFQTCQQAGGVITDGEPVKCTTLDGRTFTEQVTQQPEAVIDQPHYGDLVTSPLLVTGHARGTWFFEAQLPVTLKDDAGNVLLQTPAHAQGDWMTSDFVPFSVTLDFNPGNAEFGVLIVSKDNPSGLPQNDSSVAIPVRFK